jgi:hypothetical protein
MNPSSSNPTEPALTAWTTASGVAGGLVKVSQLKLQLLNVTWDGSVSVIVYAVLSAAAGYITKSAFDFLVKKTRKPKSK